MRRAKIARRTRPHERYGSLASFYTADARRIHSRECDFGLWWREDADGPLHRAAWVLDTGELYLVRLGPADEGGGQVEVLARIAERERLEQALRGWRERCGETRSLRWLRRVALSVPASADGAPARPGGQAPTKRPSRRTGGSGDVYRGRGRALPT